MSKKSLPNSESPSHFMQFITCSGGSSEAALLNAFVGQESPPSAMPLEWGAEFSAHSLSKAINTKLPDVICFSVENPHLWVRVETYEVAPVSQVAVQVIHSGCIIANYTFVRTDPDVIKEMCDLVDTEVERLPSRPRLTVIQGGLTQITSGNSASSNATEVEDSHV